MILDQPGASVHYDPRSSQRDKYLFALLFALGTAGILTAKQANWPEWIPVMVALSALAVYAVLVTRVDRFRLREDRAGDNAYYLGFLFTLTSLSLALYAFQTRGATGVEGVIGDFALALVSTIAGVAIRVWFQQLRDDPVEFEHESRLALGEAAARLRSELVSAVEDMAVLRKRMATELQEDLASQLKGIASTMVAKMTELGDTHVGWLSSTAEQLRSDREQILGLTAEQKAAFGRVVKAQDALVKRIETAKLPTDALQSRFGELCLAMDGLLAAERHRIGKQVEVIKPILAILGSVTSVSAGLDSRLKATLAVGEAVADAATRTGEAVRAFDAVLKGATSTIGESAKQNSGQLEAASSRARVLNEEMEKAARALSATVAQSSTDVLKVQRELVRAVESLRKEVSGGRD